MEVICKKIPPDESQLYRSLRLESLKFNPESFETSYQESINNPQLHFEKIIKENSPNKFVMGAYVENQLVGLCAFVDYNNYGVMNTGTLIQMYVTSEFRGNNISHRLIDAVTEVALKMPHILNILLEVKETNHSAVKIYNRAGFNLKHINNDQECMILNLRSEV
jgi:GNAT superfamily N-acetyltransferase